MSTFWIVHGVTFAFICVWVTVICIREKEFTIGNVGAVVLALIPGIAQVMLAYMVWFYLTEYADKILWDWKK